MRTREQSCRVTSKFSWFNKMTSCAVYALLFVFRQDLVYASKWNRYWCNTYWMHPSIVSLSTNPCASCSTLLMLSAPSSPPRQLLCVPPTTPPPSPPANTHPVYTRLRFRTVEMVHQKSSSTLQLFPLIIARIV